MKVARKSKSNIFSIVNKQGRIFVDKIHQKTKRNVVIQAFISTIKKFCKNTDLHGLKYIFGEDNSPDSANHSRRFKAIRALQKLFTGLIWSCICFGLALFALTLMKLIYDKYQSTPIITVVDTNNYPIWNINFPSVTICNVNKVYAPAAKNITQRLLEKGFSNQTITHFLYKLGTLIRPDYINATFISLYATLEDMGYNTETVMLELRQPCDRLIKQCFWLGNVVRCDQLFRTSRSSEGFCCAFNYKASKQFLETDNSTNAMEQINAPVLRVAGYGPFHGLTLTLQPEVEHYITNTRYVGAVIFIHGPYDYPDTKVSNLMAEPGSDVDIAIIPNVVESSNAIRDLSLQKRKCYFPNERELQVSAKYSSQGCVIDCTVEHIVEYCSCIPFFYPHSHLPKYKNNRQCNLRDVICLRENQHIFASFRVPTVDVVDVNDTLFGMDCDCLPSCSEQIYEIETTTCHRSKSNKLRSPVLGQSLDPENTTTINIHFKDISCIKYRRELGELGNWEGVLAAFGGIFSLCWGGSIISLFEFIYYWTFEFVESIFENKRQLIVEKKRYRHLIGVNKQAQFKPVTEKKLIFREKSNSKVLHAN